MEKRVVSIAVAAACSEIAAAAAHGRAHRRNVLDDGRDHPPLVFDDGDKLPEPPKRRLTVDIKVEAEAIGDTPLGHLVVEALREFITANPKTMTGKFESTAGLDVSWTVRNEYFNAAGERVECDGSPLET